MTRRKQMAALSPSDPRYRDAARIADAVLSGEIPDPTAGATHFLNPDHRAGAARGSLPERARGEGQPIGQHTFYAPNGGVPAIDQTEMPVDAADVSLSCSGQEAEKVPDEGLMTLADRG